MRKVDTSRQDHEVKKVGSRSFWLAPNRQSISPLCSRYKEHKINNVFSLRSSRFVSFSRRRSNAGERRSTPGVSEKIGERWGVGEQKGGGCGEDRNPKLASPPPSAPYYSHSLPISFPSRKRLLLLPLLFGGYRLQGLNDQ